MDNATRACAVGFLIWIHGKYGTRIEKTYQELQRDYQQFKLGTVRNLLLELIEAGYLTSERRGKRAQTFIIDETKYKNLVA